MADAQVIPIRDSGAAARPTVPRRPRCDGETAQGNPCRNYAVENGFCRVHRPTSDEVGSGTKPKAPKAPKAAPTAGSFNERAEQSTSRVYRDPVGPYVPPPRRLLPAIDLVEALRGMFGEDLREQFVDVGAFLKRRLTGNYPVDDFGLDVDFLENVIVPLLRPFHQSYFRVASIGADRIPAGAAMVVANHAGTVPVDGIITKLDLYEETGRHARELAADLVFKLPVIGPVARKTGATLAHGDDAKRLLDRGELVAVWPEGFKGIGKPYKDRYKLQRFGRGGFVATALRSGAPIIPTAIVGSEEIYPMIYNFKAIARMFGLPYFPIVAQMPFLPFLGPLAMLPLPSKWVIEYGEPIDTAEYGPDAADDPMAVFDLTDRVRETIQQMLYTNLMGRRSVFY